MGESIDNWRQVFIAIIAFTHAALYFVIFFVYAGSKEPPIGFVILCLPEVVTSLVLIKGALQKKAALFVPWLFITIFMVFTTIIYISMEFGRQPIAFKSGLMVFSTFSMVLVCRIGWQFSIASRSYSPNSATDRYPLNTSNHNSNRTAAAPNAERQSAEASQNTNTHVTTERYSLLSRHNRPSAPPAEVAQSAVVNVNTSANIADEPPAYDEAVAKVPYSPYHVVGQVAAANLPYPVAGAVTTANLPYPVTGPVAAPNLPYPVTGPANVPNLPYPVAESVVAPNPPYPIGDPLGAPTLQQAVGDSTVTRTSIVGWRTDLFPENPKM